MKRPSLKMGLQFWYLVFGCMALLMSTSVFYFPSIWNPTPCVYRIWLGVFGAGIAFFALALYEQEVVTKERSSDEAAEIWRICFAFPLVLMSCAWATNLLVTGHEFASIVIGFIFIVSASRLTALRRKK